MPRKLLLLVAIVIACAFETYAQSDILSLTERTDLTINQIENLANAYFKKNGTARGTGYKQFERWLYEAKFHVDANGYLIPAETEWKNYRLAKAAMRTGANGTLSATTWTELGPTSWNKTTGWNPGVGQVTSIAVSPADTTKIYISSPGGGIWKSTNSGASWSPLMDNVSSSWMNVFNITIDPSNQNIIYAAVTGSGVIKSTDGGVTWAATGTGPFSSKKVLVHPSNSNIIFATGSNGIYRSTNGGSSWTQVHNQSKEDIEFKPGDPNTMYAAGTGNSTSGISSFWRSADNGVTWTAVGTANGVDAYGRTLIGVSPANPSVVYLLQASGSNFGKFYKSTDSGNNFTTTVTGNAANGTNYFGYNTDGTGTTGQATYDMGICVNPLNSNEVHIAGIICFKSTDGGSTFVAETAWSYPNSIGYNHADVHALEWVGKTIYSGSDGGIYKSVDYGDNWTDLSTGMGTRQFYRISNSPTNGSLFVGGAQDNGTSIYKSTGWIDWLGADGMDCLISPVDETLIWGTSQNGMIYRSTNQGSSYSSLTQPSSGQWVTPLAIEANSNTIYGGWTGVYKSTDKGTSWTKISGTTITTTLACLAVAPSDPNYIYASNSTSLYVTTDGGTTWSTYTVASAITSIAVSKTNPSKIWITCNSSSNRVFVSTNAGAAFTNISGNLPAISARSVAVDDDANETVYVGMNVGVYYIDNTTSTWTDISSNLPLVAINDLKIQKSAGKLRVATYGRGVWETNLISGAAPTCSTPTSVTATSITNNSAVISWGAVSGANSYDLQYKVSSASAWTTISAITGTSSTLTGLTGNTVYTYQVKTNCSSGGSGYTTAQNFTTLADPCSTPAGLTSSAITNNSATVSWTAVSGANSYDLQYKVSTASTWTTVTGITTASYNLTGLTGSTTYNYQVRTNCSGNNSTYSTASNFTTQADPCNTPTNVSASSVTNTGATISWTAVSGANSYDLQYKISTASTWTTVSGITATSYSLSGLTGGTTYNYQVKTNCSANGSAFSSSQSFTTLVDPCNTPTNITAGSVTNTSALISWTAVSNASSYDLQYKVASSSIWTTIPGIATNSCSIAGLAGNTTYNYQVKTNCSANSSTYSASQSFTTLVDPCNTPTNVTASSITNNSATISWTGVSGAVSYDLQYKASTASVWITVTAVSGTSYNLSGLTGSTTYNYQVKTNCSANGSAYSTAQNFTTLVDPCNTPTNVSASQITNSTATISWTAVSGAISYSLQYKVSSSSTWTTVTGITTTSYDLSGLTGSTTYNYQVKTNCSANGSAYSTTQSFSTSVDPCNTPTNVTASSITNTGAKISWATVTGAISYDLQYKVSTASTWTTVSAVTGTSYTIAGLTASTTYSFQVKTNCSANGSAYSTAQNFTTLADPCTTPTNVAVSSITNTGATISWTAVTNAVSYDLQYKLSTASSWTTVAGITATSYNLSGLTGNTAYNYQVKTNCSANGSGYSTAQSFTTLVDPCNTPTNITVTSITNAGATISWTAVSNAVSYDLQYKVSTSSTWTTVAGITAASYSLSGLTGGTTYSYQVKTNCSANGSAYSTAQNFTTLADPCTTPINLAATAISNTGATISWTAVSNAVSYDLQYKLSTASSWTTVSGITSASYNLTGLSGSTTYNYQVKTNCSANGSAYTASQTFTTLVDPCNNPTNVNAGSITNNSATISWTAVSGAVSYDLQYKEATASTWITFSGITSNTYTLTGLKGNTAYNYQVKTNCSANRSSFTSSQTFTTLADPCNTPANVTIGSITYNSAVISWTGVSGAISYDVQYKLSSSGTWTTVSAVAGTSYSLTNLLSLTSYDFQVKTNCSANGSAYSTLQSFTTLVQPCGTPGNPAASNITATSATITWTAVSGAVSYEIAYKPVTSTSWITISGVGTTSYTLTGLASNTQHDYQVKANCSAQTGTATAIQSFTTLAVSCGAPTNVVASGINNATATITWDAIAGAQNYYIKYKKQKDKNWITTATFTDNTYQVTGLSSRSSYYLQVWVNCTAGSSYYTQIAFKTGTFKATNKSTGEVNNNDILVSAVVAPNPASDFVDVILSDDNAIDAKLMIIDMYGRTLKVTQAVSSTTRFDLKGLAAGVYQVKVIRNGMVESKSFIKQ